MEYAREIEAFEAKHAAEMLWLDPRRIRAASRPSHQ